MSTPITSLGQSGLPLEDLLAKFKAAEQVSLTNIKARKTSYENSISALSKVKSAVEAVQKAAAALGNSSTLFGVKNTITGGTGATATTAAGAVPGQYKIEIERLATSQRLQTQGPADRTEQIGNGDAATITIALNDDSDPIEIKLEQGKTSLNDVVKAINSNDKSTVSASVVSSGGVNHLVLTAKESGTEHAVSSIQVSGNNDLGNLLNFEQGVAGSSLTETAAVTAKYSINGIEVESQSNTSTAIDGITLTLSEVTPTDKPLTLTVSRDIEASAKAIQSFVTAYNALQTTISSSTSFDTTALTQGALNGDSTTRNIQNALAATLRLSTGTGSMQSLSSIGVTTDPKTGLLSVDDDKLTKALTENAADVTRIFSSTDGGLAERVDAATSRILGTDGTIQNRTNGLTSSVKTLQDQYDRTSLAIDNRMATMRAQFTQLDLMVVQMNNTANYLTQQFAALTKSS